jgi:WD40 repeat protein
VDVYLYSSGGSSPQFVQHDVAYGTILPYQAVHAGDYSVQVRAAGASASSNPVFTASLTVTAGGTYTVVPLGVTAHQGQLRVIDNNLTTPTGKSFVRVIQADLNQGQVTFHCSCAPGVPGNITTDAAPGTVSAQAAIPAGTWTMSAIGPSATASLPVTLTAGTVHTEIVVSKPGGGIEIVNLVDGVPSYQRVDVVLPNARNLPITSVALSPSGATLAVASAQICLWDIAARSCVSGFGGASVNSIAFSPDGKTLATGDRSGNTYLWNVATASKSAPLTDPNSGSSGVLSVAFSPDGKFLAAGDSNGRTYLWNVAARTESAPLSDPNSGSSGVLSVAFSPDGKFLAAGDSNGRTYLWNIAARTESAPLSDPNSGSSGVLSVAFSPDGKLLAAGDSNGSTYLWNVATGSQRAAVRNPNSSDVLSVAFSPDGKLLVVGDKNGRTYLWNVATAKVSASLTDPGGTGVISVACSPDNTTMAAGDNNGRIYVWNVITRRLIATLTDPNNVAIDSVTFNANGTALAVGDQNGGVFLWNISLSP